MTALSTGPTSPRPSPGASLSTTRFLAAWSILLGGLAAFWLLRPVLDTQAWNYGQLLVLFSTSKVATLLCLPDAERRGLRWSRLAAFLVWPGMQPRLFLPGRSMDASSPAPTLRGCLANLLTGVAFLWVLPALVPASTPRSVRVGLGLVGFGFLALFALMDAWVMAYRRCGIAVDKLWVCPLAATSLNDFWGRRWNRIFAGMLREVLFLPLARRVGVGWAVFAVFLYSGLLHENTSVAACSGYGGPTVYFLLQLAGVRLENGRVLKQFLRRYPGAAWVWTFIVVLAPLPLLLHPGFIDRVLVPSLKGLSMPGLS